jgi:hypothetical protein
MHCSELDFSVGLKQRMAGHLQDRKRLPAALHPALAHSQVASRAHAPPPATAIFADCGNNVVHSGAAHPRLPRVTREQL